MSTRAERREDWREHPKHKGVEVSTAGRVRKNGEISHLSETDKGYLYASCEGRSRGVGVLVLETFVGPRPDGRECDHINSIRPDNRLTNLRWLNRTENRTHQGSRNAAAQLTEYEATLHPPTIGGRDTMSEKVCANLADCIDGLTHQPGCPKYDPTEYGPYDEDWTLNEMVADLGMQADSALRCKTVDDDARLLAEAALAVVKRFEEVTDS